MKGLMEKGEGGIHLHIKHGGIVQESKHPQEGFSPIEVTNIRTQEVKTKYIKRYKGVEAIVKKIEWYDREFDGTPYQGWKLVLDAAGTICTLDFPFESRVGSRFAKLAENIDFALPVEFSAWKDNDGNTAFSVKQNNENVPQKYTREDPGDCPAPTQGFNKKWNFDAQKEFLHKRMVEVVIPKIQAIHGAANGNNGHQEQETKTPEAVKTEKTAEQVLSEIQTSLKEFSEERNVSVKDAMEQWFDTRVWAEVEKIDPELLRTQLKKIDDELTPF